MLNDIVLVSFLQFNQELGFVWLKSASIEVVIVSGIHQQLFLSVLFDLIVKNRSCKFTGYMLIKITVSYSCGLLTCDNVSVPVE